MVQPIVCVACGAEVPYGRLSCPSCGELLASVAGARRPTTVATVPVAEPVAPPDRSVPPGMHEPVPSVSAADAAMDWPDLGLLGAYDTPEELDADFDARHAHAVPTEPPPPGPVVAAVVPSTAPVAPTPAPAAPMPGAYVPPVLQPAGAPAPARTWAGHPPEGGVPDAPGGTGPVPGDPVASGAMIPAARAIEGVGWLAVASAALIVIGFLLPWSSISVIGAAGVGYFDRWGFAGDGHPLVLLAVLAVLALAVLRDRVPLWLGVGVPGLALGGILLGLVWPYLVGPLGGQIGVLVVALGAVGLIVAGAAAIALDRHERGERVV